MTRMKLVKRLLWLVVASAICSVSATTIPVAAGSIAEPDGSPLRIVASTPIIADIVGNVGGDEVAATSVIPANGDPHAYEATPADIVALLEGDAFIAMGKSLEPFIEAGAWRRAVRDAGLPELTLGEEMTLITRDEVIDHGDHVHDLRGGDPHVWLDPTKVVEMVGVIETFLGEIDPDNAAAYAANATTYRETLNALDREVEDRLAGIPPDRRKLVVVHDAYAYFAARYDFEVIGVVLKNPGAEPSAKEIADLHDVIRSAGVTVVFAEPQFHTGVLDQIAAETGVEVAFLLTDSFAGTVNSYVDLMRFNVDSLERHLTPAA